MYGVPKIHSMYLVLCTYSNTGTMEGVCVTRVRRSQKMPCGRSGVCWMDQVAHMSCCVASIWAFALCTPSTLCHGWRWSCRARTGASSQGRWAFGWAFIMVEQRAKLSLWWSTIVAEMRLEGDPSRRKLRLGGGGTVETGQDCNSTNSGCMRVQLAA
ncbi:hypothetical protein GMOD_00002775 [Pyrenophora seminiperda CCB06]|uniref:Uncharacterized protein n=1 Tax=Pyrenophora seminiperda CCB06 TaxID=1302712 RepID=A0A3M7M369_9PLEO|nr:hypothetical protein GMOD_00002775 [Pyrenophora seminiperda CCB06]